MPEKKKWIVRDFIVYSVTIAIAAMKQKSVTMFTNDMRYFKKWRKYRYADTSTLKEGFPWLTYTSLDFLESFLKRDMRIFEYGSGGSTIYFSSKVDQVISVEHNKEWFEAVRSYLKVNGIHNVEIRYSPALPDSKFAEKSYLNPDHFISILKEFKGMSFESYCKEIDPFPNEYFDLVVVDGRARISCMKLALQKVKKNGFLLLDNADRSYYHKSISEIKDKTKWKANEFIGHLPFASASILDSTILYKKLW